MNFGNQSVSAFDPLPENHGVKLPFDSVILSTINRSGGTVLNDHFFDKEFGGRSGGTVLSVATLFESDQGRALNDHFFDKEFGG